MNIEDESVPPAAKTLFETSSQARGKFACGEVCEGFWIPKNIQKYVFLA